MKPVNAIAEHDILDAAYRLLLSIGMQRMTMADLARSAGVSRTTLYRRWGSVRDVIAALTTREWTGLVAAVELSGGTAVIREQLVTAVVQLVRDIRTHPLLRKIIESDPDFLMPYLLHRRGANTDQQLDLLEKALKAGMSQGSVRVGDPGDQAKAVLLTAWSFTLTGPVLAEAVDGEGGRLDLLDVELRELLDRYLTP
jgi:AcrR family transcriptional regulator